MSGLSENSFGYSFKQKLEAPVNSFLARRQCCGSASMIVFSGYRIPDPLPYSESLVTMFWSKVICTCNYMSIGSNIFLYLFKSKITYHFVKFVATKKDKTTNFPPLFCCWIRSGIRDKHPCVRNTACKGMTFFQQQCLHRLM